MSSNICLVEVLMLKKCKDDKFWLDDLINEFHVFDCDYFFQLSENNNTKQEKPRIRFSFRKPDIQFTKDVNLFQFQFFGQNLDGEYANGLDFERGHIGYDIFDGWENDLAGLGDWVLANYQEKGIRTENLVRFVTIWIYNSWQDSYYGEFESEWDLVGLLNIEKLQGQTMDSEKLIWQIAYPTSIIYPL
jgi:hypothetical protein